MCSTSVAIFYSDLYSCHEHNDDPNFCNMDNFNNHFI